MTETDFTRYQIRHFTHAGVRATGADPADVQPMLMQRLDAFAGLCGRRVVLLRNGMTTGEHVSVWHRRGLAADVGFCETDVVDIQNLVIHAANAGFRGIGVYWGGAAYSMHLDCRPEPGQWARWKQHGQTVWNEGPLIVDPRTLR
jgi:hypothetical protein